jgi:hypothetical protein
MPGIPPDRFAAMAIVALPVAIIYLALQKQIVSGLTAGGVKARPAPRNSKTLFHSFSFFHNKEERGKIFPGLLCSSGFSPAFSSSSWLRVFPRLRALPFRPFAVSCSYFNTRNTTAPTVARGGF